MGNSASVCCLSKRNDKVGMTDWASYLKQDKCSPIKIKDLSNYSSTRRKSKL